MNEQLSLIDLSKKTIILYQKKQLSFFFFE